MCGSRVDTPCRESDVAPSVPNHRPSSNDRPSEPSRSRLSCPSEDDGDSWQHHRKSSATNTIGRSSRMGSAWQGKSPTLANLSTASLTPEIEMQRHRIIAAAVATVLGTALIATPAAAQRGFKGGGGAVASNIGGGNFSGGIRGGNFGGGIRGGTIGGGVRAASFDRGIRGASFGRGMRAASFGGIRSAGWRGSVRGFRTVGWRGGVRTAAWNGGWRFRRARAFPFAAAGFGLGVAAATTPWWGWGDAYAYDPSYSDATFYDTGYDTGYSAFGAVPSASRCVCFR